jgi:hypothetical protein
MLKKAEDDFTSCPENHGDHAEATPERFGVSPGPFSARANNKHIQPYPPPPNLQQTSMSWFLPCDRLHLSLESEKNICNDCLCSNFPDSPHISMYPTDLPSLVCSSFIHSIHVSKWIDNTLTTRNMITAGHGHTTLLRQPLRCLQCTALCRTDHSQPPLEVRVGLR